MAAIRLEVPSEVCPSWRRQHFPSDVGPLTEWEGAKGAVSMVDILEGCGGDIGHDKHPGRVDGPAVAFVGHMWQRETTNRRKGKRRRNKRRCVILCA